MIKGYYEYGFIEPAEELPFDNSYGIIFAVAKSDFYQGNFIEIENCDGVLFKAKSTSFFAAYDHEVIKTLVETFGMPKRITAVYSKRPITWEEEDAESEVSEE